MIEKGIRYKDKKELPTGQMAKTTKEELMYYLSPVYGKEAIKDLDEDQLKELLDELTETFYKVLLYKDKTSLIKFEPKTGKKHQLRIVAKNLGCPIVGDQKYNLNQTKKRQNLKLNAYKLEFDIEDNKFKVTSAIPKNFTDYLKLKGIKFNPKII